MKILCVIPSRAGSKRLKNKNVFPFLDKPLVQHTIETAKKLSVETIVVSSDSNDILNIAGKLGVATQLRPDYLSSDNATTDSVVLHILDSFKDYDAVLLLQPTSPILRPSEIEKAISIFIKGKLPALVSVNASCKFSGGYVLVKTKDLLEQKTLWVKGLHIRTDDFGDIDDLSDLRCLEAFLAGRTDDYDQYPIG